MHVIIKKDEDMVGRFAAEYVASKINAFKKTLKKRYFVLGLPTGSTPLKMYAELIKLYNEGKVSFESVITFNMDEYLGLPPTDHESYHYFMYDNFFNHINIKKGNIHILYGMAKDPEKECADYEKAIVDAGGIDLFVGGVGQDGHIAFNEPFSSLASRTRVQALTEDTIKVNSRFFGHNTKLVPTHALTVGIGTIMDAKEVMILALGKNKAKAIQKGVEGNINHQWTISALQLHPESLIVCDNKAASKLSCSTKKYFLNLQK